MIIRILITIIVYGFLGWLLCDISPSKEYGWLAGIWHGLFFIVNFVRSWFSDALFKAEIYTTAYNIFYWIFSIITIIGFLFGSPRRNRYY